MTKGNRDVSSFVASSTVGWIGSGTNPHEPSRPQNTSARNKVFYLRLPLEQWQLQQRPTRQSVFETV